jgi:UDP-3-O-[3-hydroxymyristoyl] N-acetylglucosamine deacetylase
MRPDGPFEHSYVLVWVLLYFGNVMAQDFLSSHEGYRLQKTLKQPVAFDGVGLHTGAKCKIRILPAEPNHGIIFFRSDTKKASPIYAHYDAVVCTRMATTLGYGDSAKTRIQTVEHVMAALYGLGIVNARIEVNGPEIPILDGSAAEFLQGMLAAGIELQAFSTPTLRILKAVKVYQDGTICELLPRDRLRLTTSIDFPHPAIGPQTFAMDLTPRAFADQVGQARTFGFYSDVERLRANNLALGASLENVLAFSETGVVNKDGTRFPDECVRHKLLDALGDLALCGCWIEGELVSFRGGHHIHHKLLKSLKSFPNHWEILPAAPLPGLSAITSESKLRPALRAR